MSRAINFTVSETLGDAFNELVKAVPLTRNELATSLLQHAVTNMNDDFLTELIITANDLRLAELKKPKSQSTPKPTPKSSPKATPETKS